MDWFAGVGSRQTPERHKAVMMQLASALADYGWGLRSGNAPGPDRWFYNGFIQAEVEAFPPTQIFLPWYKFNGHTGRESGFINALELECYQQAWDAVQAYIGHWDKCSNGARMLHTRNMFQVLGPTLDQPVKRLICWAKPVGKQGQFKGGTNTAIQIAKAYEVPILNLYYEADEKRAQAAIKRIRSQERFRPFIGPIGAPLGEDSAAPLTDQQMLDFAA